MPCFVIFTTATEAVSSVVLGFKGEACNVALTDQAF